MPNEGEFAPGDILVFQIESGYGLLKVIGVDQAGAGNIWHIRAFRDLFMDVEMADMAAAASESLSVEIPHAALTDRAFESTQVSLLTKADVTEDEAAAVESWRSNGVSEVTDRSVRLLLGLR